MDTRDWLLVLSMVLHFAYTVWAYIDRRGDKTNEKIVELTTKVSDLDSDVTSLKALTEKAPSHADLGKVYEAIKDQKESTNTTIGILSATVHQLVGENRGQTDMLRSIYNRLAEKGLR